MWISNSHPHPHPAPAPPLICPQVDSSLAEMDALSPHLRALLAPAATLMDLNIGAALWLAARAVGVLHHPQTDHTSSSSTPAAAADGGGGGSSCRAQAGSTSCDGRNAGPSGATANTTTTSTQLPSDSASKLVCSAAPVVLLGHGADEQCGGYGRHRTAFRTGGWSSLARELQLDMTRLWQRNLGRDDRLVGSVGREGRHPFLGEGVVAGVRALLLQLVADLRQAPGERGMGPGA
jgi:asparagine synthetase B (glutamine-hydrolysing)